MTAPPTALPPAISARGLRKRYGRTDALDGFDLEVPAGTVHGLLGPNGAGKTTAVRCLSTLTRADAGAATIAGLDVRAAPGKVRRRLGLVGQSHAIDEALTGRQNLTLFARLSGLDRRRAHDRTTELLDAFDLTEAGGRAAGGYSGGMRRRLDIAAALVLRPDVLFLDEPTTGLDPRARATVWAAVRGVAASGTTVLLTTQLLDEADQLADHVSIMQAGRVIADGTPAALKDRLGGDRLTITIADRARLDEAVTAVSAALGVRATADADTRTVLVEVAAGARALAPVVRALDRAGVDTDDVLLRRPTLDEVFLHLTGGTGERRPGEAPTPEASTREASAVEASTRPAAESSRADRAAPTDRTEEPA